MADLSVPVFGVVLALLTVEVIMNALLRPALSAAVKSAGVDPHQTATWWGANIRVGELLVGTLQIAVLAAALIAFTLVRGGRRRRRLAPGAAASSSSAVHAHATAHHVIAAAHAQGHQKMGI